MLRTKAFQLYRQILRVGQKWEAKDPANTQKERQYIREETRKEFRRNKDLTDPEAIKKLLEEGHIRLEIAQHYRMSTSKIDNSKFDREALNKFHSVVANLSSREVQRLLRYYYAGSALVLQMDLRPLLSLDGDELCRVFEAPFRTEFNGKSTIIGRVMDRLIELFTENSPDTELDIFYETKANAMLNTNKTHRYFIGRTADQDIFLQENSEAISQGTTGLSSWIACYFLANYLILFEKLDNQVVVELGAGCGLAGITALKYNRLRSLISTDFDLNVLRQLSDNFLFNFGALNPNLRVEYCDWNDQKSVRDLKANADLVIASDVIYDPDLLEPFVCTLETLTADNPKCRILIAGQERNPETLEKFLQVVENSSLQIHSRVESFTTGDETFIRRTFNGQPDSVEVRMDVWIAPPQHLNNIKLFELRSKLSTSDQ